MTKEEPINPNNGSSDFILYTSPGGEVKVEIYVQDETVWLTQQKIAELFGVSKSTISEHLSNIFESGNWRKKQLFGNSEQFKWKAKEKSPVI